MAFFYSCNFHLYVSLASRAFSNFICDWIGVVSDYFILHASSPQATLSTFDEAQVLDVKKNSNEENGGLCRNFSFEKDRNDGDSSSSCDS